MNMASHLDVDDEKCLQQKTRRHTVSCTSDVEDETNESIEIIELQSEPEMDMESTAASYQSSFSDKYNESTNDTFLELEDMLANLPHGPGATNCFYDNNIPKNLADVIFKTLDTEQYKKESNMNEIQTIMMESSGAEKIQDAKYVHTIPNPVFEYLVNDTVKQGISPVETVYLAPPTVYPDVSTTPKQKKADDMFKTPKKTNSVKKNITSALPKSPGTVRNYKHVMSPVALYINCSPQTPLIRDIVPKKPLPKVSILPELTKNPLDNKQSSKDNVELTPCVYRCAKTTKVIKMPDTTKFPQASWSNKIINSAPVVRRHISNRDKNVKPILIEEQDSICNLSNIPQADLSIQLEEPALTYLKS